MVFKPARTTPPLLRNKIVYQVEIRIAGQLDSQWADWLEGLQMTHSAEETILTGQIADQTRMFGLVAKLRDLGVKVTAMKVEG